MAAKPWNLVADIGGTNARFGVEDYASSELGFTRRYSVEEYNSIADALQRFLKEVSMLGQWQPNPQAACLAVACPIERDSVQFTNSPWYIERPALSTQLGGAPVDLINDFAAVGYGVIDLKPRDWHQVGVGSPVQGKPIAILGPGTGLGVCTLVPIGAGYQVLEGEGGHVDFAPVDPQEIAVLEILTSRFGRVSAERLLSGAGIVNIYCALAQLAGKPVQYDNPAAITDAALQGVDSLSVKSLSMFCRVLGSVAGSFCLALGAKGGVYIAGGIVPRFIDFLEQSDFRHRFEAKGRFRSYMATIPVRVVLKDNLGLHGAVKKLSLSEL
jgi:glucokinase